MNVRGNYLNDGEKLFGLLKEEIIWLNKEDGKLFEWRNEEIILFPFPDNNIFRKLLFNRSMLERSSYCSLGFIFIMGPCNIAKVWGMFLKAE